MPRARMSIDRRLENRFLFRAIEHGHARAFVLRANAPPPFRSGQLRDRDFSIGVTHVYLNFKVASPSKREDGRENPEAHDDGVFLPAAQLEMMMNRRHREDAFAGQL